MSTRTRRPAAPFAALAILAIAAGCSGGAPGQDRPSDTAAPAVTDDGGPRDEEVTTVTPAEEGPADTAGDAAPPADGSGTATFGAGCFWCVEAVLEQLDGVTDVRSGYMGGDVPDPTYRAVCSGTTGHAEVVQVDFDPARISYETLLDWFFRLHDPTTLDRQGADVGTQYRSVIFHHSDAQRAAAEKVKARWDASGAYADPIVTEIAEAAEFYEAEQYHQDYYRNNKDAGYCRVVIRPKLDKLGLEK